MSGRSESGTRAGAPVQRVLVVGSGGREHAIAWKLHAERPDVTLLGAPGNPGIAELGRCYDVSATAVERLVELAVREQVDLVVVGPELPLSLGLVDRLRERGIAVFGPTAGAARLETSKSFAKEVMNHAGVPTARAETHTDADEARLAVRRFGAPVVVKATGLAAGKGVVVCASMEDAYEAIDMMLLSRGMGDAGAEILVEEFMQGEELSLFYLTDGTRAIPLVGAQDHKRLRAGDEGPNTGGMGAYAPVTISTPALVDEVTRTIVLPMLRAMRERDCPFTGLLYVGLMLTAAGPKVVEFNCRFGDPETQALLPLLDFSPTLLELMTIVGRGEPLPESATIRATGHAVTTVVAAAGYPEAPRTGDPVVLPPVTDAGVEIFHAGTRRAPTGELLSAGGRVVAVTAVADTIEEAHRLSAAYADRVELTGKQYRDDIAWRELERRRAPSAGAGTP